MRVQDKKDAEFIAMLEKWAEEKPGCATCHGGREELVKVMREYFPKDEEWVPLEAIAGVIDGRGEFLEGCIKWEALIKAVRVMCMLRQHVLEWIW